MEIKDSGARTEFESGAVRDVQEGKGRCDLMPLDVAAELLGFAIGDSSRAILSPVSLFQQTGNAHYLYASLIEFCKKHGPLKESAPSMLLEVAIHFEEGAKKYGESNWQKGIPVKRYVDSGVRHYLKVLRGDTDEPHARAFMWNLMAAIWTCEHKPELNDYANE